MEPRDLKILKHIGLYRISLRPVLSKLFFDGKTCGNVVHRLIQEGSIQSRKGLPGNLSYYQLTAATASDLGLPVSRATLFGAQALHTHLGILWFCCMMGAARYRLENGRRRAAPAATRATLQRLFGADVPRGDHCIEEAPVASPARTDPNGEGAVPRDRAGPIVYNVYVPGPGVRLVNLVREIRQRLAAVRSKAEPARWLQARCYAFAMLVETPERRAALRAALRETNDDHGPLLQQAYVRIEVVPGYRTVWEAVSEFDD